MEVRYLGPLEVVAEGRSLPLGGPKQRLVLAHLLVDAGRTVTVDRLIDRVWSDGPPAAARSSLHSYVSNLRQIVGAEAIVSRGHGYAFDADGIQVDRREFEALVARARRIVPTDPAAAADQLRAALRLWRGPAFADLSGERSLAGETARLADLRLTALLDRVAADLACGRAHELVGELRALTAAHPLHEGFWAQLMLALYRSGRQGEALAAFAAARAVLAEQLGVDPSPELARVQQRILQHDDMVDVGVPALRGYRLLERVGVGPAATVWRAVQPGVARVVALKALRPRLADDPAFIRRFAADAQAVARVEHPHVVPLYDCWREPDGAFVAMRYLVGGDVAHLLARNEPPTSAHALGIVAQAAAGVGAAHRLGVVHGHLSATNVLLDGDGRAYVSDLVGAGDGHAGAAPHVAPECRAGGSATAAADVYALGVLLHALAPAADGAVADVVARATATEPAQRQADATAFLTDLRAAAPEVGAEPAGPPVVIDPDGDLAPPRNPYKGLRAFAEGDADDFFGRDAFVTRLVARLGDPDTGRFVTVVGPSGSGKSSAVRAGLIPALRGGALPGSADWYVAQMLPGRDPFAELATALRPLAVDPPDGLAVQLDGGDSLDALLGQVLADDHAVVLVIDQFEELFTQVDDADRRARFLRLIADAADDPDGRVRIVVTLRADYYDRPLREPAIADLVRAGTEAVVPLTAVELERAVTGPAEGVGMAVDRDLVAQLVADVAAEPAGLPLLQYALTEVFDHRSDRRLTLDAYRSTGGITGALTRRADAELDRLAPPAREAARQLFLRLVTPADSGSTGVADDVGASGDDRADGGSVGDTRRRVPVAAVTALAPGHMSDVVAAFGDARLLAFDRDPRTRAPTVEVAHEALLREWRRLRGWIDATRDDLRVRQRLTVAAADWEAADRDPSFLARGRRLDRYERWRDESGLTPTGSEQTFLAASLAARDDARREEAARAARERDLERRSVRRLRALAVVLGVAAVIAAGLTVFAVTQAQRAGEQAQVATARELAAAAAANLDVDPERSILLAREAVQRTREVDGTVQPEVASMLHEAVGASRIQLAVDGVGGYVDWSPDGDLFVTEGPEDEGVIDLRDAETGASVRSWKAHEADINCVVFGPDGELLASGDDAGTLSLWDATTGEQVASVTAPTGQGVVWRAAISPDGTLAAGAWEDDGLVRLVDTATGEVVREIEVSGPSGMAFAPDGGRIAVSEGPVTEGAGDVLVYDVSTGETVLRIPDVADGLQTIAWSPDGRSLAVSNYDPDVLIYDAVSGDLRGSLTGHTATVTDLDWSADASMLVTAGFGGTAKVWEMIPGGGREIASLSSLGTAGLLYSVRFSPDGSRVLGGDAISNATAIWDIGEAASAEGPVIPTRGDTAQTTSGNSAAVLPDGTLAVLDPDGGIGVWSVATGDRLRPIGATAGLLDMPTIGGGGAWVAASADGVVSIWDARTSDPEATIEITGTTSSLAASADTALLAVADGKGDGSGGTIRLYAPDGTSRGELPMPGREIINAELSPNGRWLAAASVPVDRLTAVRVDLWDVDDGRIVHTLDEGSWALDFDASSDRLVVGIDGGAAILDAATGDVVRTMRGDVGAAAAAAFSDDGTRVATTTDNGSIRVWDAERGVELVTLQAEGTAALDAEFSPDGSRLITADEDGAVRQWLLDLDELLVIADDRVTRDLTDDECRQYLHVDGCEAP